MGLAGLQGGYLRYNEPKGRIRVDFKPKIKKNDLGGALLWLGFGRGVRVSVVAILAVSWFSGASKETNQSPVPSPGRTRKSGRRN